MHYNGEGQGRECRRTMYLGQMTEEEHDDDDGHQSQRLPLLSALHHRPPAMRHYFIAHMYIAIATNDSTLVSNISIFYRRFLCQLITESIPHCSLRPPIAGSDCTFAPDSQWSRKHRRGRCFRLPIILCAPRPLTSWKAEIVLHYRSP